MRYSNDSTAEDLSRYAYAEPGDAVVRRNTKENRTNSVSVHAELVLLALLAVVNHTILCSMQPFWGSQPLVKNNSNKKPNGCQ